MNRADLISSFEMMADIGPLGTIAEQAADILRRALDVKIVIGEGGLSAEHFQKIGQRRLSRCKELGHHVAGLEETVQSLATASGGLRAGYAEAGDFIVQFFLDDTDVVKGCIIGEKAQGNSNVST